MTLPLETLDAISFDTKIFPILDATQEILKPIFLDDRAGIYH